MLGLPYAFASHFAPAQMTKRWRSTARCSARRSGLRRPYVMLGVNVFAADTDAEARRLFTSLQQAFLNLRTGRPGKLPPPVDEADPRLADPPRPRDARQRARLLRRRRAGHGAARAGEFVRAPAPTS
jgi:alkanesulfonate monooxygenase SsuD/methylene tetrahydromethanopterin reductase-like flavin-dependent oxidoreductase (luciferase family)